MFKVNEMIIGKTNNGYQKASSETMLEVTRVGEGNIIDAQVVGKFNFATNTWKKAKVEEFYNLDADKFRAASNEEFYQVFPPKSTKAKVDESIIFNDTYKVLFREDGTVESNINRERSMYPEQEPRLSAIKNLVEAKKKAGDSFDFMQEISDPKYESINMIFDKKVLVQALDGLIKFFKEFEFTPSIRFVNTLSKKLRENEAKGIEYVNNYFALCDNLHKEEVADKIKSAEFKEILRSLSPFPSDKKVNNRLIVWYGAPGTGKTYHATEITEGRCIVCNNDLHPNDLLEDFLFVDGKPTYIPSLLVKCMEQGLPITLDEGNLLNSDVLSFLQGLTDNKPEFNYKDRVITIKDGFKIYLTMNLVVSGDTRGLTEALTDRAEEIREFTITGSDLLSAF